jgi:guanylate cyclase
LATDEGGQSRKTRLADEFQDASVLFADIVDFTRLQAQLATTAVVELINELFTGFDVLVDRHGAEKIKTIGDCYMAAAGVLERCPNHAHVLACLALDMMGYVQWHRFLNSLQLDLRIGINSGPLVEGVVGQKKFAYDLWGDTVNTASRMESHGFAGRIQITKMTYELLRDDFECEAVGEILIKGKGPMRVWHLLGRKKGRACWTPAGRITRFKK